MNWFIFALMPPILWGLANVIDKFFMTKILKEELNRYNILMKSISILLILAGTWLLV